MDTKVSGRRSIRPLYEPIKIIRTEVEPEMETDDDTASRSSYSEEDAFKTDQSQELIPESGRPLRWTPEKPECDVEETPPPPSPKRIIPLVTSDDRNESTPATDNRSNKKVVSLAYQIGAVLFAAIAIAGCACGYGLITAPVENKQCNTQDDSEIWINLKSGINEVKSMNKPSVFLYIYNSAPEDYIDEIVKSLSEYASCSLNGTDDPIELTSVELKSSRAKSNYGHILEKYRNELVLKKVMVVKHLEQVPGVVAQVFHSFCDEINPLVEKSLFLFTMKVDVLRDKVPDYTIVEEVLRRNWSELDEDIFDPLLTRISNMILRINKSPAL